MPAARNLNSSCVAKYVDSLEQYRNNKVLRCSEAKCDLKIKSLICAILGKRKETMDFFSLSLSLSLSLSFSTVRR